MGRVGVAEDGSLDKAALLKAIREVEFEGASRQVRYDSSGERDESETPVILKNARAITTDDGRRAAGVAMVETWQWWPGESGGLKRVGGDENAPVWPGGGAPTWTVPPDRCPPLTIRFVPRSRQSRASYPLIVSCLGGCCVPPHTAPHLSALAVCTLVCPALR